MSATTMNALASTIKEWRITQGFHTPNQLSGDLAKAEMLAKLMLVVTEVSEMAECVRIEDQEHFAEELADVLIRMLDIGITMGIDIDDAVARKMAKNRTRPKLHGKKCVL
jgi:NTP pyrophosphatase (non-canonical NTP hydrolase)